MGNSETPPNPDKAFESIMREVFPYTPEDIDPYEERGRAERVVALVEETGVPVGYFVRKLGEIPREKRFFQEVLEGIAELTDLAANTKSRKSIQGLAVQAGWLQRITFLVVTEPSGRPSMPLPYDSGADMVADIEKDTYLTQPWKKALKDVIHTLVPEDFPDEAV